MSLNVFDNISARARRNLNGRSADTRWRDSLRGTLFQRHFGTH